MMKESHNKKLYVRTTYEHCDYFKPNKDYEVTELIQDIAGDSANVIGEDGMIHYILLSDEPECAYLNGQGVWELIEE